MNRILSLMIAGFLVAAAVPAAAEEIASVTAEAIQLDDATVVGALASFRSIGEAHEDDPVAAIIAPTPETRFPFTELVIEANNIVIRSEVETREGAFTGGDSVYAPESSTLAAATLASTSVREKFLYFLAPQPGHAAPHVEFISEAATLLPAANGGQEPEPNVPSNRAPLSGGAALAVNVESNSWQTLRVTGDFVLMLWEIDLTATHDDGVTEFPSGYSYTPTAPDVNDIHTYGESESRQVYVWATDAVLEVTFTTTPSAALSLRGVEATAERVTFESPTGFITTPDGRVALQSGDSIQGELTIQATAAESLLEVTVAGDADHATLGVNTITYPESSFPTWIIIASIAATLLLAIGAAAASRPLLNTRRYHRMEALMDRQRYPEAIAVWNPSLGRSRHGADAEVIRAVALLRLKLPDDAEGALNEWRGPQDALFDFLWAHLHALRGDRKKARQRLTACLEKDPTMQAETQGNPLLENLISRAARPGEGYT